MAPIWYLHTPDLLKGTWHHRSFINYTKSHWNTCNTCVLLSEKKTRSASHLGILPSLGPLWDTWASKGHLRHPISPPDNADNEHKQLTVRMAHLGVRNPGGWGRRATSEGGGGHTSCQQRISGYDLTPPSPPYVCFFFPLLPLPPDTSLPSTSTHTTPHHYIIDPTPAEFCCGWRKSKQIVRLLMWWIWKLLLTSTITFSFSKSFYILVLFTQKT